MVEPTKQRFETVSKELFTALLWLRTKHKDKYFTSIRKSHLKITFGALVLFRYGPVDYRAYGSHTIETVNLLIFPDTKFETLVINAIVGITLMSFRYWR